jgi:hypothetical protein
MEVFIYYNNLTYIPHIHINTEYTHTDKKRIIPLEMKMVTLNIYYSSLLQHKTIYHHNTVLNFYLRLFHKQTHTIVI